MLVIRRRAGEAFRVGDEVEVEILELAAGQVKIGIKAPRSVRVLRSEVHQTQEQNRAAAGAVGALLGALARSGRSES